MPETADPTHLALYKSEMLARGVELAGARLAALLVASTRERSESGEHMSALLEAARENARYILEPLDELAASLRANRLALEAHGLPTIEQLEENEATFVALMAAEMDAERERIDRELRGDLEADNRERRETPPAEQPGENSTPATAEGERAENTDGTSTPHVDPSHATTSTPAAAQPSTATSTSSRRNRNR